MNTINAIEIHVLISKNAQASEQQAVVISPGRWERFSLSAPSDGGERAGVR